jgi:hypothetical protein
MASSSSFNLQDYTQAELQEAWCKLSGGNAQQEAPTKSLLELITKLVGKKIIQQTQKDPAAQSLSPKQLQQLELAVANATTTVQQGLLSQEGTIPPDNLNLNAKTKQKKLLEAILPIILQAMQTSVSANQTMSTFDKDKALLGGILERSILQLQTDCVTFGFEAAGFFAASDMANQLQQEQVVAKEQLAQKQQEQQSQNAQNTTPAEAKKPSMFSKIKSVVRKIRTHFEKNSPTTSINPNSTLTPEQSIVSGVSVGRGR